MNTQIFDKNSGFDVSAKYVAINTKTIVDRFTQAGFELQGSSIARVRNPERNGYQKHLLRFAHPDLKAKQLNDIVPQIVLRNSFDGSSSFQLWLGIFRLVCANGLIVGSAWQSVRVRHVGQSALDRAIEGAFEISKQVEALTGKVEAMKALQLTEVEQNIFASEAARLILPETAVNYSVESMLKPRRSDDTASDLWTVFNRVQETAMRGGLQYTSVNGLGNIRRNTGRNIRSIDRNIDVNQKLWTLAETTLQAKGA